MRCDSLIGTPTIAAPTLTEGAADDELETADRKLKQLIQLESSELTTREKGRALGISQGAVWKYQRAVRLSGITEQDAQKLDETELERRVWQARTVQTVPRSLVPPDCAWDPHRAQATQACNPAVPRETWEGNAAL
jgi:hypothetical protein